MCVWLQRTPGWTRSCSRLGSSWCHWACSHLSRCYRSLYLLSLVLILMSLKLTKRCDVLLWSGSGHVQRYVLQQSNGREQKGETMVLSPSVSIRCWSSHKIPRIISSPTTLEPRGDLALLQVTEASLPSHIIAELFFSTHHPSFTLWTLKRHLYILIWYFVMVHRYIPQINYYYYYLRPLTAPGQTHEQLLLRHCRVIRNDREGAAEGSNLYTRK